MVKKWKCGYCGAPHSGLAMVFGPDAPAPWTLATDPERQAGELGRDTCVLPGPDGPAFFLRGHIYLPVIDSADGPFIWSVWVSLSESSARTTMEHWDDPERARLPPVFGWLCNDLPYEIATMPLPTHVHQRAPGEVPLIELDPSVDHPLVREQLHGVTMHRVAEINRSLLP